MCKPYVYRNSPLIGPLLVLLAAIVLILATPPAEGDEFHPLSHKTGPFQADTVVVYTGKRVTLSWEPSPLATSYVAVAWLYETKKEVFRNKLTGVNNTSVGITLAKDGHYIFGVKAKNSAGASGWAFSTVTAKSGYKVDGKVVPFWYYAYPNPAPAP